jgi:phospho-N-acetylmuramoyl-pentapeptide-transferase
MIVGASNAVNLTDGLDGLAAGTLAIASVGLGLWRISRVIL